MGSLGVILRLLPHSLLEDLCWAHFTSVLFLMAPASILHAEGQKEFSGGENWVL